MPNDHSTGDTGKSTPQPGFVGAILNPTNTTPLTKAAPKPKPVAKKTAAPKKTPAPAAASAAAPAAGGSGTVTQFATDVLKGLGYPVTSENIRAFQAWAQAEGGHAAFNPLNTTQHADGASNYNSVGVKNYTSYAQGVAATVQTLQNGHYGQILTALSSGKSAMAVAQGVASSPWGTGQGVVRVLGGKVVDLPINGGTINTGAAPVASAADVKSTVASTYGYLSAFLNDPEIGPIIQKAAAEGWDQATLEGALYKTKFWQTHSATTRQWDAQGKLDPATQRAQIQQQEINIQAQMKQSGMKPLGPQRLMQLATDSLRFGWTAQQLTNGISAEAVYDFSGKTPSAALATLDTLKETAAQYLVPMSDKTLQQYAAQIQKGDITTADFQGYVKEQAKSLFPSLSHAIDSGTTVAQYADPYKQIAAQTLERNPDDINFTDPKWNKALFQIDSKTGARTAMNLNDWTTMLKSDPNYGYANTHQANQQAAAFGNSILQTFGKIAG